MSPIYLYREAIRLQCFMHMRICTTLKTGNTRHIMLTTFTRFAQNSTIVSVLALYGSTNSVEPKKAINLAPLFEDIRTTFFSA